MRFFKNLVCQLLKLQFCEDFAQFLFVGFHESQFVHIEFDGDIGLDGCEEVARLNVVDMLCDFFLQRTLQFVGSREQLFDASEFVNQFHGRFLANAGTSGEVVG